MTPEQQALIDAYRARMAEAKAAVREVTAARDACKDAGLSWVEYSTLADESAER